MRSWGGPALFVTDTDGCLTDGTFGWTGGGTKLFKLFGPDDGTALTDLQEFGIPVLIVSADTRGEQIIQSRAAHMKVPYTFASEVNRLEDITRDRDPRRVIYVGDGRNDAQALAGVGLSFSPNDGHPAARRAATYELDAAGGHRAVAEAIDIVIREFK